MDTALTDTPDAPPQTTDPEVSRWLTAPTFEEVHTQWLRFHRMPIEVIDPDRSHFGQFVAFFDGKPWGYDPDPTALMERFFATMNVHPNRVLFEYLG